MNKTKILSRKGTSLKLQYPTSHKFEGGGDILSAGLRVASAGIEGGLANSAIKDTASLDDIQAALMSLDTDVNSMDDLWNIRKNMKYASTNNTRGDFMKNNGYYFQNGAKAALSGATAGAQLGSIVPGIGTTIGTIGGALVGTLGSLIGGGIAGNKARKTAERENRESLYANNYALSSLSNSGNNIIDNNMFDYYSNYAALGGKLNKDYPIGLTFINAGGTHEENPNEGVPAGIAPDGKPNLVEQGEVIYNDYVFSNRFPIPDDILEIVGLPSKYKNNTPARIAERESAEIAERPNDIISKNNLDISLGKLTLAQELTKQRSDEANQQTQNEAVTAACGGRVHKLARGSDLDDSNQKDTNQGNTEEEISSEEKERGEKERIPLPTWMRYAPVANSIWQVLEDAAGITNVPDYTEANSIRDAYSKIRDVSFRPVNTYVRNTPINRGFYLNTLGQNAAATRSAIKAQSGLNRGTAIGSLAAADYTANMGIGNLMRNLEDMDFERGLKTAEFNRGTESLNSQGFLSAGNANMQADANRARGYNLAATVAAQERQRVDANRTANRNILATNLGLVGRENAIRNMSDNPAFLYQLMKDFNIGYKTNAKGGKINRRKHHA